MTDEHPSQTPGPRRRWLQFGLRTIMLVILAVAVALAWLTRPETLEEVTAGGALSIERQVIRDDEDLIQSHGRWRLFDSDGGRLASGAYSRDEAHGAWTIYDRAGEEVLRGESRRGKREGPWTAFYANGARQYDIAFVAGVPQGPAEAWWPDGQRRWQGEFLDGARHGTWSYWDAAGTLRAQGEYVAGREEGPWRTWDEAGQERPSATYVGGRVVPPDADTVIAHWKERLTGDDAAARVEAVWALSRIGPPALPALRDVLSGQGHAAARAAAVEVLGTIGPAAESVEIVAATLRDDDLRVVRAAAEALRRIGPAAEQALTEVRRRVADETDDALLRDLLAAAATIAPQDQEAIRRLLLLVPPGEAVADLQRYVVGERVSFYGARHELAPALALAARDADQDVALAAVSALGHMAGSGDDAVRAALLAALGDPRAVVRLAALQALTGARLSDESVRAAIEAVANGDPDTIVRGQARDILSQLYPP